MELRFLKPDTLNSVCTLIMLFVYNTNELPIDDTLVQEIQRYCPRYTACSDVTNMSAVHGSGSQPSCCLPCSCDPHVCNLAGNCCPDVMTLSQTPKHSTPSADDNITVGVGPTKLQCIEVFSPSGRMSESNKIFHLATGIYMVAACPKINGSDENKCLHPDETVLEDNLPYTSLRSGLTYRNIFCARCHGDYTELLPWKMFIACTAASVWKADDYLFPNSATKLFSHMKNFDDTSAWQIEFLPPNNVDVTSQLCTKDNSMVNNCSNPNADNAIISACETLNMPYIHVLNQTYAGSETQTYANVFCYLCSSENISGPPVCPVDKNIRTDLHSVADVVGELNIQRANATLVMSAWEQTDRTHPSLIPSNVDCDESYVYDPYTKSCRQWYCPGWREQNGDSCIPVFDRFHNMSFTIHIKIALVDPSENHFFSQNVSDIAVQTLHKMYGVSDSIEKKVIVLAVKKDRSFLYLFARLTLYGPSENTRRIFDEDTYTNNVAIETNNGSFNVAISFPFGIKLELSSFAFLDILVIDLIEYNVLNVVFRQDVKEIESCFGLPVINKLTFCTQILLARKEFRDYNDNLFLKVSDVRLRIGEFMRIPSNYNELRICLSDYLQLAIEQLGPKPPEWISPQAILSVVCSMLSIIGLVGTIFTYIIFDELRSIPGKNNMMLAVHLLIAQLLYQFAMDKTEMKQACVVFGMLIHWFWLTAIFWMNACTLHMFRTFVTGKSYRSVRALDPQVLCYALYSYSFSVIMVSINVAYAIVKTGGKEIGYGGRICYISDPVMVGWVFALPVGVIILLNMGFFFAVVYQISASTMRRRGKSTDRANTIIYMKLSSLTGATWIFGYLFLWTDFVPFEYIFIVLNAGQGVFIFISFICTQRTIKLYRAFFRKHFSQLRACACFCMKKRLDSSDTQTAEPNTVKATLTAGSSTDSTYPNFSKISQRARGFAASLGIKLSKSKSSSKMDSDSTGNHQNQNQSNSRSNSHSQSNSDIFQESSCTGRDVSKAHGSKKNGLMTVSGSIKKDTPSYGVSGVYKPDKVNQSILSSTTVAAVSVHDLNFQVNQNPMT